MVHPQLQLLPPLLHRHWQHHPLQRTSTKSFPCRFRSLGPRQARGDTHPILPRPRRLARRLLLLHRHKIHMHPPHLLLLYQETCLLNLPCSHQSVWTLMLCPRCWLQVHRLVRLLLLGTPPSLQVCNHRPNHLQCRDTHQHLLLRDRPRATAIPLSPWPFQAMSTICPSSLVPPVLLLITKRLHTNPTRLRSNSRSRLRYSRQWIFHHHVRSGLASIKGRHMPHSWPMVLETLMVQAPRLPNGRLPRRLRIAMHHRSMSTNSLSGSHQTVPTLLSRQQQLYHRRPSRRTIRSLRLLVDPILPHLVSK